MESAKKDLGIEFLALDWQDSISFSIPEAELVSCVEFVHAARMSGSSVLVHCAQVRGTVESHIIATLRTNPQGSTTERSQELKDFTVDFNASIKLTNLHGDIFFPVRVSLVQPLQWLRT